MRQNKNKLTGVIGWPLAHSLSPFLHNAIYKNEGVDAEMRAYEGQDIAELVKLARTLPLELMAVTIPHKQTIMPLLDVVDAKAKKIGAVNTVINRGGVLTGYNTDIIGVKHALAGVKINNKNVLIIGAGGAAQPVAAVVSSARGNILCLNRTGAKAEALVKKFGGEALTENQLRNDKIRIDVIINTTPIGLKGEREDELPLAADLVEAGQTIFDCVYNPFETQFLQLAKERGAKIISGLKMFVAQALAQEELWLAKKIINKNYEDFLKKYL